jgi:hypothetical protein
MIPSDSSVIPFWGTHAPKGYTKTEGYSDRLLAGHAGWHPTP